MFIFKSQVRDSQRKRVYTWDHECVFPTLPRRLDLQEISRLVDRVAKDYGLPRPIEIRDGRGRRHAAAYGSVIKLPRWSRTVPCVLHEVTHEIVGYHIQKRHGLGVGLRFKANGDSEIYNIDFRDEIVASHGPEFVRVFIELMARYAGSDSAKLEESATEHGIRVAQKSAVACINDRIAKRCPSLAA